ncbi:uncharacterized protein DSM5745_03259 [Aspergillus mulundensis]|uniref:Zn(2)-C6 fungal-type domain-containing protein n=1 Tax=Aspergillus mulundensis TaxID=1810919 RepID=A0A3D8SJW0_9EURO|nr:hypothetical protein DSM5745_03259 [Aspergillus mulundensis]RDW86617.1 hypothetical protein DSM5745_03259 [Aspergillus mulundensis]
MLPSTSPTPTQQYTAEACFACKSKKRKCDKQLPACSRCRKVDQECLYGIAADGVYGKIVPATNNDLSTYVTYRATSKDTSDRAQFESSPTEIRRGSTDIKLGLVWSMQQVEEAM